jgi:putative ABC transport system permease protein
MSFSFWRKKSREQELDEELASHLQMAARDRAERGESQQDAEHSARREFGNPELVKETARDAWSGEWLHRVWLDVRFAVRSLLKSPGFCAVAVATLALGIGANTAIFSVIHEVLLAPLPYKNSKNIVDVYTTNEAFKGFHMGVALGDIFEMKKSIPGLTDLTAYNSGSRSLTGNGKPKNIDTTQVMNNFFEFLGSAPQLGRFFIEEEHTAGHEKVAVISDSLWRTQFGSDRAILGKQIRLDGKDYTVVGVAGPILDFPSKEPCVWLPLAPTLKDSQDHNNHAYEVLAHLRGGAYLQQTNSDLAALSERIEKENKDGFGGWRMAAVNLQESTVEKVKPALLLLFGAVMLVLLIACANVANLLLARGWQRHKEMALRTALGATRWRIARLLLTESVLLAVSGGISGLAMATWAVEAFRKLAPAETPRLDQLHPDWAMAAFALLCAILVGVLFGILPAMQAMRWDPNVALKETSTGTSPARRKLRDGVAVLEIALALPLLVSAGLLVKGFSSVMHTAPGYRLDHILVMSMELSSDKYPSQEQKALFARQILENVSAVPGVDSAALAGTFPLSGMVSLTAGLRVEGVPDSDPGLGNLQTATVSDDFFRTMEIPVLRGRGFTKQDNEKSVAVAVVNETMARDVWKGRDPIGTRLSSGSRNPRPPLLIVGVVADTRDISLNRPPAPKLYYAISQNIDSSFSTLVRTKGDAAKLAPALQDKIWSIDKDQPIEGVQTIETVVAESVAGPRFLTVLLSTFSLLGMTLALIGIYGVVSYSVSQRTREIGVRVAMGAARSNVLQLVIGHGLRIALAGIAIGVVGALLLTKFLASQLYGVSSRDPWIFSGVAILLASAAILACYIPARRAMKLDPMVALRYE